MGMVPEPGRKEFFPILARIWGGKVANKNAHRTV